MSIIRPLVLILFFALVPGAHAHAAMLEQDTLNRSDPTGLKTGWWKVVAPKADKPGYKDGQLIEEGRYANGKRTGTWKRYWPSGKLMSEITYVLGRPKGPYKTYYPDGKPEEQGNWDLDRNTGTFKRWHPNGNLAQEFIFNSYGVRDGEQKYYHENGQLAVKVNIEQGKEEGNLTRYYSNGDVQQVAQFNDGVINQANSKYIKQVHKPAPPGSPMKEQSVAPVRTAEENTNSVMFRENGYNTLYDKQLRLSQTGEFKAGRMWNGKVYKYGSTGEVMRIEVYIEGRYAGNGVITEEDRKN